MNHQHLESNLDYIDLRSLFQNLIQKKWSILFIAFLVLSVAITCSILKPAKYQTSSLLKIQQQHSNVLGTVSNPSQQSSLTNLSEEPLAVQIALIQSEFILRPVISTLSLQARENEFDALKRLRANLTITDLSGSAENNVSKTAILRLTFTGNNPRQITKILNQIAISTQQQNIQLKIKEVNKTLSFLNQQLPNVKQSLKAAETKLNQFRSSNGNLDIKFQREYLFNQLSDVNKHLEEARIKKANLLLTFTPNHPSVITITSEMSALEKQQTKINLLLNNLPAREQEALNLKREVEVNTNLYMMLLNQIHQLAVIKTGIMSDVEILSPASTPYVIQPIKLPVIAFLSLFVGLILGCIFVLSWQILSKRINHSYWIEQDELQPLMSESK